MIFMAVGTQFPFDRLTGWLDRWAAANPDTAVRAQIGRSNLRPAHIDWTATLAPHEFHLRCEEASLIIGHAGMGLILAAFGAKTPIIVVPRLAELGEHRNDHQVATCKHLAGRRGLHIAEDESEALRLLDARAELEVPEGLSPVASEELTSFLAELIDAG